MQCERRSEYLGTAKIKKTYGWIPETDEIYGKVQKKVKNFNTFAKKSYCVLLENSERFRKERISRERSPRECEMQPEEQL